MTLWLIIGSDGLVGAQMLRSIPPSVANAIGTTRHFNKPNKLILDLANDSLGEFLPRAAEVAFICAAVTSMQSCADDPILTSYINVTQTERLAKQLLDVGCFVVFLSSNTVFDGMTPWPQELTQKAPNTEYGWQKAEAERRLLVLPGADRLLAIVRLSKILSGTSGIAHDFITRLRAGQPCRAFSDLMMAPASLSFVANGLIAIAKAQRAGVFHLSGAAEMSYAEFAKRLAARIGVAQSLVQEVNSTDAGVNVLFKPVCPGLGMQLTQARLGLMPEPFEKTLDLICAFND